MDVYRRYGPALLRKCERILGNREDAQDIVQGMFVDMLQRNDTARDLPYLYRAVTNRSLNFLRDERNRKRLLEREEPSLSQRMRVRGEEDAVDRDLLQKLVLELDRKHLEILIYYYFDDMSQDEVASLVDTSRKTVGKRLDHIRTCLTQLRSQEGSS